MGKALDLVGRRFGRLLVTKRLGRVGDNPSVRWECACDCGRTTTTPVTRALMAGVSRSCGCLKQEMAASPKKDKPYKGTKTHNTWVGMLQRCRYKKHKQYKDYGGKGVTVCERWLVFENFLEDMGERPDGKTLDRIDTNGNYEPTNCRWATSLEQGRNRDDLIRHEGRTVQEWADFLGVNYHTVYYRIRRNGSLVAGKRTYRAKGANT